MFFLEINNVGPNAHINDYILYNKHIYINKKIYFLFMYTLKYLINKIKIFYIFIKNRIQIYKINKK